MFAAGTTIEVAWGCTFDGAAAVEPAEPGALPNAFNAEGATMLFGSSAAAGTTAEGVLGVVAGTIVPGVAAGFDAITGTADSAAFGCAAAGAGPGVQVGASSARLAASLSLRDRRPVVACSVISIVPYNICRTLD